MGRRSKAVKLVGGVRGGLALLDDDERRRVIEAGERDIDDGVGFFLRHGSAWHGVDGRVRRRVQGPFQGRDPAGIGRGLVTSVMREPGIRGARRGGPGLAERGFEAGAPNRLHRSSGCRTPERTETGYYANQAAQAAPL